MFVGGPVETLLKTGMVRIPGAFSREKCESLLENGKKNCEKKTLGVIGDEERRLMYIYKRQIPNFVNDVAEVVLAKLGITDHLNTNLVLNKPAFLFSFAGCGKQRLHFDFNASDMKQMNVEFFPFFCIVGLMDGTKIDVLMINNEVQLALEHGVKKHPEGVRESMSVEIGEIVVFRGDAAHGGSAYENCNARMHLCFMSNLWKQMHGSALRTLTLENHSEK